MEQYTKANLASHASTSSCWYALYGVVFDFTNYINKHPGGVGTISGSCGTVATEAFESINKHNVELLRKKGFSANIIGRLGTTRGQIQVPCSETGLVAVTN